MAEKNDDVIDSLNDLIETCRDGEEGFRAAAKRVGRDGDPQLRTLFDIYAQQRAQFRGELQNEVLRRGGEPENSGHVSASLRRGWLGVKSALESGPDYAAPEQESDILADCESGERAAVENYEDALEKNLPSDLMEIIQTQYREIRQTRAQICSLAQAFKPAA